MTYSILAHCPSTGRVGLGTGTFSMVTYARADAVRGGVGAAKTQANPQQDNDLMALDLIALGYRPARILEILAANDPYWEYRQMGIIDHDGNAAAFTGDKVTAFAGHHAEPGFAVLGNVVAGQHVIDAIVAGFKAQPDDALEYRILMALEAGRDAGGQARQGVWIPERSAVLRVAGRRAFLDIDIGVDVPTGALEETRRVLDAYLLQEQTA